MTSHWVVKHQHLVPAAFVSFFAFTSDPARNSLNDNQLKNDINNIKGSLYKSEYKTRFAAVLLSDKTVLEAPDIEERLANIKRATGLDPKNSLFVLPPNSSRVEIASVAVSILTALKPLCVEYYRDLTKHARRKKSRSNIPPPTLPPTRGTSQTLAALGWGIRYDFKLGVFAEFRQEMESACRHYTSALESLLGPDGVFETTASWSPRWDEARLLADITAFRIIRCLLWSGSTSMAAQSWENYRERIRSLVDRRGKGSLNYGWEAWESKWAKLMAQLIQRTELPIFDVKDANEDQKSTSTQAFAVFAPPEKAIPLGERMSPWHNLHHPGYWMRLAARHAIARRRLAYSLPEDDRTPPGQSPASAMVNRYGTYDTYMCPEPHVEFPLPNLGIKGYNHSAEILDNLNQSISAFKSRGQQRLVERLQFDAGKEIMRIGNYAAARNVLKPLWRSTSWRQERWWGLLYELGRSLRECARLLADVETLVATQYELYSNGKFVSYVFLGPLRTDAA
jgi:trafficking protein particle complex subunit 11